MTTNFRYDIFSPDSGPSAAGRRNGRAWSPSTDQHISEAAVSSVSASSLAPAGRLVELGEVKVSFWQKGAGERLLILHRDSGHPGWIPFYERLSEDFEVIAVQLPGFSDPQDRPEWAMSVRDIAVLMNWMCSELPSAPTALVGLGFGGWVAAEMASMAPHRFARLVLVSPMGVRPEGAPILDQALLTHEEYVRAAFHDQHAFARAFGEVPPLDRLVSWDIAREMTFRIAWRPYMYSDSLPYLLGAIRIPTMVVWGSEDRVVDPRAASVFASAIPAARLELLPDCGHFVELEQEERLASLLSSFLQPDEAA
jgi:pimeloyl-ACP methyl ester carboxylesterase